MKVSLFTHTESNCTPYLSAIIASLLLAGSVGAEEAAQLTWYLGADVGRTSFSTPDPFTRGGKIFSVDSTRTWADDTSQLRAAHLGLQIFDYLGVEASYWDFGEAHFNESNYYYSITTTSTSREQFDDVVATIKGYSVGIVGSYPWRNWRVSAKFNAFRHKVEISGVGTRTTSPPRFPAGQPDVTSVAVLSDSQKETRLMYGPSISYTFARHYVAELYWVKATHLGNQADHEGTNVTATSIALKYRF